LDKLTGAVDSVADGDPVGDDRVTSGSGVLARPSGSLHPATSRVATHRAVTQARERRHVVLRLLALSRMVTTPRRRVGSSENVRAAASVVLPRIGRESPPAY
jgi:hypothetical protein